VKQIAQDGLDILPALVILAGLALGMVFVRRQSVLPDPLLDLKLFRVPAFSVSLITYTLGVFVAFGAFLFIAQYLQLVVGLSPWQAGLWSAPGAIASIVGSNVAPVLVRRLRPAYVVAAGLALAALGFGLITQADTASLLMVVVGWVIISLGFGLTFTVSTDLVVGSAPVERAGAASALSETGAELGGALGIAVLGSLGMAVYRSQVTAALPPGVPWQAAEAVQDTLGSVVALAGQMPGETGAALLAVARAAFAQALQLNAVIAAVVMAGLAIMTAVMLRDVRLGGETDQQPEPEHVIGRGVSQTQPDIHTGDEWNQSCQGAYGNR
jgi:DHA2 family multidrug resistance protein-like MFS transporter